MCFIFLLTSSSYIFLLFTLVYFNYWQICLKTLLAYCKEHDTSTCALSLQHIPKINGEIPSVDEATLDHQRLLDRY